MVIIKSESMEHTHSEEKCNRCKEESKDFKSAQFYNPDRRQNPRPAVFGKVSGNYPLLRASHKTQPLNVGTTKENV